MMRAVSASKRATLIGVRVSTHRYPTPMPITVVKKTHSVSTKRKRKPPSRPLSVGNARSVRKPK